MRVVTTVALLKNTQGLNLNNINIALLAYLFYLKQYCSGIYLYLHRYGG